MGQIAKLPGGILIPGRCLRSAIDATQSSYTEAGPRPGSPVVADALDRIRLERSGEQAASETWRATKAGTPGRRDAAFAAAYKLTSEGATDFRGWNPPHQLAETKFLDPTGGDDYVRKAVCTVAITQKVVVAARNDNTSELHLFILHPDTTVQDLGVAWPEGSSWNWPALVQLPSGRMLLLYGAIMYYSDAPDTAWAVYSAAPLAAAATYERSVMACTAAGDILLLVESSVAGTVHQFASSDQGATFELVETIATWGTSVSVMALPGSIVVTYSRHADGFPCATRLASPYEPLSRADADEIEVAAVLYTELRGCADWDGQIWLYGRITTDEHIKLFTSPDEGLTWTALTGYAHKSGTSGGAGDFIRRMEVAPQAGGVVMVSQALTGAASEDEIRAYWWGGWSALALGIDSAGETLSTRHGSCSGNDVDTYIPIDTPDAGGNWTVTTTGGTAGVAAATGDLLLVQGGADHTFYSRTTGTSTFVSGHWRVCCFVGGALGAFDCNTTFQLADGAFDLQVAVNFSTAGFRIYDLNGAVQIGADVAIDMTEPLILAARLDSSGAWKCFYRRPGATKWTVGPASAVVADGGAGPATGNIIFGNIVDSATRSSWGFFVPDYGATITQMDITAPPSRPLCPLPMPTPDLGTSAGVGWIAAAAGPARRGDTVSIAVEHDYPIEASACELSPSPRVTWRSTSLAEQLIVWDLGARSWLGSAVGLYVANANFRTATLEYYDGAAWQVAGTLDLAVASALTYARLGDTVYANGATGTSRYLWEHEIAGGSFVYSASAAARTIAAHSAGRWTSPTGQRPEIRLSGITGAEPASGADGILVAPSGLLVRYLPIERRRQYWAVRIPAQITPDAYFEAGIIAVGRVLAWGAEIDWTSSDAWEPTVDVVEDGAGGHRVIERGPVSRVWQIAWQSGTSHAKIRQQADDYYGAGLALSTAEDVAYQLAGLTRLARGGAQPVVVVEPLPPATATITDVSRLLYGSIESGPTINGGDGDRGVDERQRIESITIREHV